MSSVFADTSFFIALWIVNDAHHSEAVRLLRETRDKLVTTQWVLAEAGNYLGGSSFRNRFPVFVRTLQANPNVSILPADERSFEAGLQLYSERPDKAWSFIDCISIATMRAQGLQDALTTDHHFEQAGYRALLR